MRCGVPAAAVEGWMDRQGTSLNHKSQIQKIVGLVRGYRSLGPAVNECWRAVVPVLKLAVGLAHVLRNPATRRPSSSVGYGTAQRPGRQARSQTRGVTCGQRIGAVQRAQLAATVLRNCQPLLWCAITLALSSSSLVWFQRRRWVLGNFG